MLSFYLEPVKQNNKTSGLGQEVEKGQEQKLQPALGRICNQEGLAEQPKYLICMRF